MIQWTKLQLDTTNFLLNQKAKDTDEAAVFFGETYHAAMKIAADPNKNIVTNKLNMCFISILLFYFWIHF